MFAPTTPTNQPTDKTMPVLTRTKTHRPHINMTPIRLFDNGTQFAHMTPIGQMTIRAVPDAPRKAPKPPVNINMSPCRLDFGDDEDAIVPSDR